MAGLARMFLPGGGGAQLVSFPPSTSYYLVPELFSLDNTTPLLPSRTESLVLSCSSSIDIFYDLENRTMFFAFAVEGNTELFSRIELGN